MPHIEQIGCLRNNFFYKKTRLLGKRGAETSRIIIIESLDPANRNTFALYFLSTNNLRRLCAGERRQAWKALYPRNTMKMINALLRNPVTGQLA